MITNAPSVEVPACLFEANLSMQALGLGVFLAQCTHKPLSIEYLAKELHSTPPTIARYLRELERRGVMQLELRRSASPNKDTDYIPYEVHFNFQTKEV